MPRTGRPPIFDQLKQQVFLRLIAGGFSLRQAARHVGVSASTVREKKRTSPAFATAYDEAKAQVVPTLLESITTAGQRSWRASAWLLERLRPDQFGRRVALGVDPTIPRPPRRPRAYLDEEMIDKFFKRLRMLPDAQAIAREKLAEVEAEQQAWDAAKKAYDDEIKRRGGRPYGWGPGESGSVSHEGRQCDETDAPPLSPPEHSDMPNRASSANKSGSDTPTEFAQIEPTQQESTTATPATPDFPTL